MKHVSTGGSSTIADQPAILAQSPARDLNLSCDNAGALCSIHSQQFTPMGWSSALYLFGFLIANLGVRLALLRINLGEYTDGILQLKVFEIASGLYPPLYGLLAHGVQYFGADAETAGKIVSATASTLALIPVYLWARRLGGDCAAKFAALFFTLCPLILRWSVRVMTDGLFLGLSAGSLYCLQVVWADRPDVRKADRWLAAASLLAALSALTRYQGVLLLAPLLVVAMAYVGRHRRVPWLTVVASLVWLLLPAWIHVHGFVHQQQFASRSVGAVVSQLLAWLNLAESFVLISPYYLGWPIFVFALVGVFAANWRAPQLRGFWILWLLFGIPLLGLQSVFGSFQYRYMMPLFPACLALAGTGALALEKKLLERGRAWVFSLLLYVSVSYLALFTCAVLVFQRQSFGDQRAAAEYIRTTVSREAPVVANERYGNFFNLGCVKLSFWTGRKVEPIWPYLPPSPSRPPQKDLTTGTVVVLGNCYGGDEFVDYLMAVLNYYYHMRLLNAYESTVYPLLDDIMVNPIFNQNPLGWVLRYSPQLFSTHIYVIDGRRTPEEMERLVQRNLRQPVPPPTEEDKKNAREERMRETAR